MTTTYRPIVTPAFMLASCTDDGILADMDVDFHTDEIDADWLADPAVVQAVHAARAEVLGELVEIFGATEIPGDDVWNRLLSLVNALRASLDDPEEGSA